jgi:hypothetical protein
MTNEQFLNRLSAIFAAMEISAKKAHESGISPEDFVAALSTKKGKQKFSQLVDLGEKHLASK